MQVVLATAMDSSPPHAVPPMTASRNTATWETADVAIKLGLPTSTVRRVLEDIAAYGLVEPKVGVKRKGRFVG